MIRVPCHNCHDAEYKHIIQPRRNMAIRIWLCDECNALWQNEHSEKVLAGLDKARKSGVKLGAPIKLDQGKISAAKQLRLAGMSLRAIAKQLEISVASVHNAVHI